MNKYNKKTIFVKKVRFVQLSPKNKVKKYNKSNIFKGNIQSNTCTVKPHYIVDTMLSPRTGYGYCNHWLVSQ